MPLWQINCGLQMIFESLTLVLVCRYCQFQRHSCRWADRKPTLGLRGPEIEDYLQTAIALPSMVPESPRTPRSRISRDNGTAFRLRVTGCGKISHRYSIGRLVTCLISMAVALLVHRNVMAL